MNFKYGSGFAMAIMRGLVISGLFAADTLNKFAGKLVGRMCGDVQLVIFFKKVVNQPANALGCKAMLAVCRINEISQISVNLFSVFFKRQHIHRRVADEVTGGQTQGHTISRTGFLLAFAFSLNQKISHFLTNDIVTIRRVAVNLKGIKGAIALFGMRIGITVNVKCNFLKSGIIRSFELVYNQTGGDNRGFNFFAIKVFLKTFFVEYFSYNIFK